MPRGIVELILDFGELEHRCGVEHYAATKSTIKRTQRYPGSTAAASWISTQVTTP